jgi:hypothetical protein
MTFPSVLGEPSEAAEAFSSMSQRCGGFRGIAWLAPAAATVTVVAALLAASAGCTRPTPQRPAALITLSSNEVAERRQRRRVDPPRSGAPSSLLSWRRQAVPVSSWRVPHHQHKIGFATQTLKVRVNIHDHHVHGGDRSTNDNRQVAGNTAARARADLARGGRDARAAVAAEPAEKDACRQLLSLNISGG